jgi:hypothetical protein
MARNRITKPQIAKIWTTAKELGLDREMLYRLVPGGSISHLTRGEAHRLIEYLTALTCAPGGQPVDAPLIPPPVERPAPAPGDDATPEQRQLICALLRRIGWLENPRRAEGFLRKYARVATVDEIASRERASAIIEALKAIARRQRQAGHRPPVRQASHDAPRPPKGNASITA